MKIDGVPKFLKHPDFHRAWNMVLEGTPSRIEQEESVEGKSSLTLFIMRFKRWAEMALESSHEGTLPHNFSIVEDLPLLYRGGFIKPEQISILKEIGIQRVISLCDLAFEREQRYMEDLEPALKESGIHHNKITLTRAMVKENEEVVKIAREIWAERHDGNYLPTYIHCENGAKRTGKIILALRMMEMVDNASISLEYQKFASSGDMKIRFDPKGEFMTSAMDLWHLCNIAVAEMKGEPEIVHFWKEMHQIHKRMIKVLKAALL